MRQAPAPAHAAQAVKGTLNSWPELLKQGDIAELTALYTEDAVFRHSSGAVNENRDAIQAWAQHVTEQDLRFEATTTEAELLGSEAAFACGTWEGSKADGTVIARGESMVVFKLVSGEWKIHRHFSSSLPEKSG